MSKNTIVLGPKFNVTNSQFNYLNYRNDLVHRGEIYINKHNYSDSIKMNWRLYDLIDKYPNGALL